MNWRERLRAQCGRAIYPPRPFNFIAAVTAQVVDARRRAGDLRPLDELGMEIARDVFNLVGRMVVAGYAAMDEEIRDEMPHIPHATDNAYVAMVTAPEALVRDYALRLAVEECVPILWHDEEASDHTWDSGHTEAVVWVIEQARAVLGEPPFYGDEEGDDLAEV